MANIFAQPVINHVPILDKFIWPDTVAAGVSSASGIDSVWVKWYKNNTSTGIRQFKLNNVSGGFYQGAFNSTLPELSYNDSIFYKIFAQDASSYHRKDSTILYSFRHIYSYIVVIGRGIDSVSYPFYTFYQDARTQFLITKNEILAAGGSFGNIFKLGFYVRTAVPHVMNSFNIRMQNTSLTSLNGFVNSGWTTVHSGTYTVPGTGWRFITPQQNFSWNGNSNILIEICFDNAGYTLASKVCAANAPGMTWENHQDNASGCVLTGGAVQPLRPDFFMQISPTVGSNSQGQIPGEYFLSQNFPNPFNPVTEIKYSIPVESFVKIIVSDVTGRESAILVNEIKQPGEYGVSFDASSLASGVYFYKMVADPFGKAAGFTAVKKFILLK